MFLNAKFMIFIISNHSCPKQLLKKRVPFQKCTYKKSPPTSLNENLMLEFTSILLLLDTKCLDRILRQPTFHFPHVSHFSYICHFLLFLVGYIQHAAGWGSYRNFGIELNSILKRNGLFVFATAALRPTIHSQRRC